MVTGSRDALFPVNAAITKRGSASQKVWTILADPSVEPFSTTRHSQSVKVCADTLRRVSGRYFPRL